MSSQQWLAAILVAVTLVGVAVGRYPALKMNRATIALVGATLLIALGAISLDEAFEAIDGHTLLLLFAMMILNANLRAAGFFHLVSIRVLQIAATPRQFLALLIVAAGTLAAIFLNDTIVLVFTPLILELTRVLRRNPLPYLVGLVTGANIGSVATLTGNPQNMLVGLSAGLSFVDFSRALAPLALLGLVVAWIVIVLVYRREFAAGERLPAVLLPAVVIDRPLLRKALIATGLMGAAWLGGAPIPLASALAASLLLISRRVAPETVFQEIDWALLVFFCGLFVVVGALQTSGWNALLFSWLQPYANGGPGALTGVALVLSNLVSNVPAVMLFRPIVPTLDDPAQAWLTLAMATTLAGNLTLLGSVANLIVAEIARRHGVHLSFGEYLKAGTPIALITLLTGVIWLAA